MNTDQAHWVEFPSELRLVFDLDDWHLPIGGDTWLPSPSEWVHLLSGLLVDEADRHLGENSEIFSVMAFKVSIGNTLTNEIVDDDAYLVICELSDGTHAFVRWVELDEHRDEPDPTVYRAHLDQTETPKLVRGISQIVRRLT